MVTPNADNSDRLEMVTPSEAIHRAYEIGRGRWTGCDWPTDFGPRHLDLCGLTARQARLLANALAGAEAQAWREAERWLETVEQDALAAETAAAEAVAKARADDFVAAEHAARLACDIESRYPRPPVWDQLLAVCRRVLQLTRPLDVRT